MNNYWQYLSGTGGIFALTGAAAATTLYMAFSTAPISLLVDIDNQSTEIPDSGGAHQSKLAPPGGMTSFLYEDAKTLLEMMQRGYKISGNGNCLGYKISKTEYSWITYGDVIERSRNFSLGLLQIGMKPGQSSLIGIYSRNCVEWILTEQACYHQSAVIVPLYDTLGPSACSFIINQAEIEIIICDTEEKAKSLINQKDETPTLKHIILVNDANNEMKETAQEKGVQLHCFKDIEEIGSKKFVPTMPAKSSDIATISYTSGTTGNPKGVVLTHANIMIDASALVQQMAEHTPNKNDVALSFLPLAHMYERVSEATVFINGGRIGFYGGDVKLLMEDLKALKPTIIAVVPRLLNRIYDAVQNKIKKNVVKRSLFNLAMHMKKSELKKFIIRNNSIWDHLVFKAVREGMGGRVRLLCSGAAPVSGDVLNFMRCALGCVVLEGYGQTESSAPCTTTILGDYSVDHVGPPISCCHIKLIDIPEMEYFSNNNQGEVCVKGNNIFKEYFKNPQKTSETLDSDGWLHTGDVGMWLPNGTLKIIDRRKHIFKLAQGEYIVPEKIEKIYLSSPYVAQIFVDGDSLQSFVVAIVVPEHEQLLSWCKNKGIDGSFEEICKKKLVKQFLLDDIISRGRKAGLKSFEQVKDICLHSEMFTVENGLLTPTFKTKRGDCKKQFINEIISMYRSTV